MKLQQPRQRARLAPIVPDSVGGKPVLTQPYVQEEDHDESSDVEKVLFDRHGLAKSGRRYAQCGLRIREVEEPVRKYYVEQATCGCGDGDRPPESPARNIQAFARKEPAPDYENRDDKQQQTPGIAVR